MPFPGLLRTLDGYLRSIPVLETFEYETIVFQLTCITYFLVASLIAYYFTIDAVYQQCFDDLAIKNNFPRLSNLFKKGQKKFQYRSLARQMTPPLHLLGYCDETSLFVTRPKALSRVEVLKQPKGARHTFVPNKKRFTKCCPRQTHYTFVTNRSTKEIHDDIKQICKGTPPVSMSCRI